MLASWQGHTLQNQSLVRLSNWGRGGLRGSVVTWVTLRLHRMDTITETSVRYNAIQDNNSTNKTTSTMITGLLRHILTRQWILLALQMWITWFRTGVIAVPPPSPILYHRLYYRVCSFLRFTPTVLTSLRQRGDLKRTNRMTKQIQ